MVTSQGLKQRSDIEDKYENFHHVMLKEFIVKALSDESLSPDGLYLLGEYRGVTRKSSPSVLIEIAQKDFEVAELLFKEKLYSQAIYMLQQSLEKAIKVSLLRLFELNVRAAQGNVKRDVGVRPPDALERLQ
jgi:hypothetical protein